MEDPDYSDLSLAIKNSNLWNIFMNEVNNDSGLNIYELTEWI